MSNRFEKSAKKGRSVLLHRDVSRDEAKPFTASMVPAANPAAGNLELAFENVSLEDIQEENNFKTGDEFNESDDLASEPDESREAKGDEMDESEKAPSDGQVGEKTKSAPKFEDVSMEEIQDPMEKAPSGDELSQNNKSAPELDGGEKVSQTDQNQTSQNGSNNTDSALSDQDQVMDDPDGFAGFSLADLTNVGFLERPELYASFETSMFWLEKRLGMMTNFYDS